MLKARNLTGVSDERNICPIRDALKCNDVSVLEIHHFGTITYHMK